MTHLDPGFNSYLKDRTVNYFANDYALQPPEEYLFSKYIAPNAYLLDIGIGAGRTTYYLSRFTKYVGIDYSPPMIEKAHSVFPDLCLFVGDARDLSFVESHSQDVVVFSFNGIDCLPTVDDRLQTFSEISRVLKSNGTFIFSSHNSKVLFQSPRLTTASLPKKIWRIIRSVLISLVRLRRFFSLTFWRGHGFYIDRVRGLDPIPLYSISPANCINELSSLGFSFVEYVSDSYPRAVSRYIDNWYYYVFRKL